MEESCDLLCISNHINTCILHRGTTLTITLSLSYDKYEYSLKDVIRI